MGKMMPKLNFSTSQFTILFSIVIGLTCVGYYAYQELYILSTGKISTDIAISLIANCAAIIGSIEVLFTLVSRHLIVAKLFGLNTVVIAIGVVGLFIHSFKQIVEILFS